MKKNHSQIQVNDLYWISIWESASSGHLFGCLRDRHRKIVAYLSCPDWRFSALQLISGSANEYAHYDPSVLKGFILYQPLVREFLKAEIGRFKKVSDLQNRIHSEEISIETCADCFKFQINGSGFVPCQADARNRLFQEVSKEVAEFYGSRTTLTTQELCTAINITDRTLRTYKRKGWVSGINGRPSKFFKSDAIKLLLHLKYL